MPQGEESGIGKKRLAAFPVAFIKGRQIVVKALTGMTCIVYTLFAYFNNWTQTRGIGCLTMYGAVSEEGGRPVWSQQESVLCW